MFHSSGAANRGVKVLLAALILLTPIAAFSQASSNKLTFDVATIKPAPALDPMAMAMAIQQGKMPHIGMNIQGNRVDIGSMTLTDMVVQAFKVRPYQVTAPDWMKGVRFDVLATMPAGATKDDVPQMLQGLLADRFGMKFHKESREDNVYALVVAKGGHKLKESPPDPEVPAEAAPGAIAIPNGGQVKLDPRSGGATITTGDRGTMKVAMTPEGRMHLEASKVTMEQFAQQLNPLVDHPVIDKTELKGNFQVALDISMETMLALARAQGMNIPALPGAAPGGAAAASDPSNASSIFQSVQQLGLKLEPQKVPLEFVIVDHMEKTPTEN